MSQGWALSVPLASLAAVARLRRFRSLSVCPIDDVVWLRGTDQDETLARELRLIPGAWPFTVLDDGQLVPQDAIVPRGHLPAGPWLLLSEWLEIAWPAAIDVQLASPRITLTLVPSRCASEPALLETALSLWADYISTVPQWRIDRWSYVAGPSGRTIVRGLPLPALPGTRWVVCDGIAVPAGFDWSPPVEAAIVKQMLELESGDIALLRPADESSRHTPCAVGMTPSVRSPSVPAYDGTRSVPTTWERIAAGDWVRATRSSVRRTREVLAP